VKKSAAADTGAGAIAPVKKASAGKAKNSVKKTKSRSRKPTAAKKPKRASKKASGGSRRRGLTPRQKEIREEHKAAARVRLAEQRERKQAKLAENKAYRQQRKAETREARQARNEREREHRREVRERARARHQAKKLRDAEKEKEKKQRLALYEKKQARKKDPNAPKRPRTALSLYYEEQVAASKDTKKNVVDIMKRSAAEYKALSPENKQKYIDKVAADRQRFEEENKAWKQKQATLEDARLKQPKNSYMLFVAERRPELVKQNPSLKTTEVGTQLGAQWAQLDTTTKQNYQKQATELREKYNAAKARAAPASA